MDAYFSKFPNIFYDGVLCKNITRNSRLTKESKDSINLYYPMSISTGMRPDNIADAYYEDAEMDWMIFLANDIIDPYYDWYMSEIDFDKFIVTKYGSYENSVKKIKFYRNNWYTLEEEITPSFYDNTLSNELKKYYTPNFGVNNKILSYKRIEEDWVMNTNRIIKYTHSSNVVFTEDEIVDLKYSGEIIGGGTVITSNTTTVTIQHVSGNTTANSSWTKEIIGETSGVTANTSNSEILQINISDDEAIYWEPVTYYDIEEELNESRKNIKVINKDYALDLSEKLRISLKE